MHYQQPYELRNIKKTPDGNYQIQFIRDGKSHSKYAKTLALAKLGRDYLEKELGLINQELGLINQELGLINQELGLINQEFGEKAKAAKTTVIPGTNEPMQVGISQYYSEKRNQHHIMAVWYGSDGKQRNKSFYAGTENTYSTKAPEAYERAVEFRESWEDAVICDELGSFDPREFNLGAMA